MENPQRSRVSLPRGAPWRSHQELMGGARGEGGAGVGGRDVVVDLKELRYIDSSGINALLRARQRYTRTGQRIVLADVPSRIRRIFGIIAVEEIIPMFPTVDAALAGIRNGTKPE